MTRKPLGTNQIQVLENLTTLGPWHPGCGWFVNGPSGTKILIDKLQERGLVQSNGKTVVATPEGVRVWEMVR